MVPKIFKSLSSDLPLEFNKQCIKHSRDSYFSIDEFTFICTELEVREKQRQLHPNLFPEFRKSFPTQAYEHQILHISANPEMLNFCLYCSMTDATKRCNRAEIIKTEIRKQMLSMFKKNIYIYITKNCSSKTKCPYCTRRHIISICNYLFASNANKLKKEKHLNGDTDDNVLIDRVISNDLFNLEQLQKRKALIEALPTLKVEYDNKIIHSIIDSEHKSL